MEVLPGIDPMQISSWHPHLLLGRSVDSAGRQVSCAGVAAAYSSTELGSFHLLPCQGPSGESNGLPARAARWLWRLSSTELPPSLCVPCPGIRVVAFLVQKAEAAPSRWRQAREELARTCPQAVTRLPCGLPARNGLEKWKDGNALPSGSYLSGWTVNSFLLRTQVQKRLPRRNPGL